MKQILLRTVMMILVTTACTLAQPRLDLESVELINREIKVSWLLYLAGSDSKMTILKPGLTEATFGQTRVQIEANSSKGRHVGRYLSPALAGRYASRDDWFHTLRRDEVLRGSLAFAINQVEFSPPLPSNETVLELRVRLIHAPTDDGRQHGLDAWTGEIKSSWAVST